MRRWSSASRPPAASCSARRTRRRLDGWASPTTCSSARLAIPGRWTGPSWGRIPAYPASGTWNLSHIGPMTRTVADAALMLAVSSGPDERDPYSLPAQRIEWSKMLRGSIKGLRVGYTDNLSGDDPVDPEVRTICAQAAKAFRELGCRVEDVKPGWPSPKSTWEQMFCGGLAIRLAPSLDRRSEIDPGLLPLVETFLRQPPTHDRRQYGHRDRRTPRVLLRVDSLHVPVQPHGSTGRIGARWLHEERPAGGAADRRSASRRRDGVTRQRRVRAGATVGGSPSADRLTSRLAAIDDAQAAVRIRGDHNFGH